MYKKNRIIFFLITILLTFIIGFNTAEAVKSEVNYNYLTSIDIIYIFFINAFTIISLIGFSFTGLSFPLIYNLLYNIGISAYQSELNPITYYSISLIHGIFEIISLYIVFTISIEFFKKFFQKLKSEENVSIKKFSKRIVTTEMPIVLLLVFTGAVLEVYISNRIVVGLYG